MRSPGGGELSLSACPGVGNRPPNENKIANPRGYAWRGGMVTGRIEPCINLGKNAADNLRTWNELNLPKNYETPSTNCRSDYIFFLK